MLTKYQEITQKLIIKNMQKLANGILKLIDSNGSTTHVLNYPDYDLKEIQNYLL